MAQRKTRKREVLKDVATVIAGGLVEVIVENFADAFVPQYNIIPGSQPYNTGDALGALEATAITLFGVMKRKPKATLFGSGGLAVAVPNLVGKVVMNMVPVSTVGARLSLPTYGQGRYGRVAPIYGGSPRPVMWAYPRR